MLFNILLFFVLQVTASSLNCGKTQYPIDYFQYRSSTLNRPTESVFPWTVLIGQHLKREPKCLGTLVVKQQFTGNANSSDLVVTAASCIRVASILPSKRVHYVVAGVKQDGSFKMDKSKKSIKNILRHKQKHGSRRMKRGIVVLQLKESIRFSQEIAPICIANQYWKRPEILPCFMPLFNKDKQRIQTWPVSVLPMNKCSNNAVLTKSGGYCGEPLYLQDIVTLGAPLMCYVDGTVYQFGLYADRLNYDKEKLPLMLFVDVTRYQHDICTRENTEGLLPPSDEGFVKEPTTSSSVSSSASSSASFEDQYVVYHTHQIPQKHLDEESSVSVESEEHTPVTIPSFPDEEHTPVTIPSFPDEEHIPVTIPSFPDQEQTDFDETKQDTNGDSDSSGEIGSDMPDIYIPETLDEETGHYHVDIDEHTPLSMFDGKSVHIVKNSNGLKIVCTGSLLASAGAESASYVLTAAGCVWDKLPFKYGVYFGSEVAFNARPIVPIAKVEEIQTFASYRHHSGLKAMGIGLIKLKKPIPLSRSVGAVQLPQTLGVPLFKDVCVVSGVCEHGRSAYADAIVLSSEECQSRLRGDFYEKDEYCALIKKDALKNPKGAALSCHGEDGWKQYGVYELRNKYGNVNGLLAKYESKDDYEIAVFSKILKRPSIF